MARSVILLTTPTSGTASLFRAAVAVAGPAWRPLKWVDEFHREGRMGELPHATPPAEDHLLLFNAPERFNVGLCRGDYRFILNARDPRDLVCNQYHWQFSHPYPQESAEETAARRARVAAEGVDAFALRLDNTAYLRGVMEAARRIAPQDRVFIGYAMYCLHFDLVAARLAGFFGTTVEALHRRQRKALERERVENLAGNRFWIGQRWAGADVAPGRHRQELRPDTIAALTARYAWFLDFLKAMDDPLVTETYN